MALMKRKPKTYLVNTLRFLLSTSDCDNQDLDMVRLVPRWTGSLYSERIMIMTMNGNQTAISHKPAPLPHTIDILPFTFQVLAKIDSLSAKKLC